MSSKTVNKSKRKLLVFDIDKNIASILTRKYGTRSQSKFTSLDKNTCSIATINCLHMVYFAPQDNGAKEWQRKNSWVFKWENTLKIQKSTTKHTFRPPKGLKLMKQKKACCLPATNK